MKFCLALNVAIALYASLSVSASAAAPRVWALFDAFRISDVLSNPYDTVRLKVLYPEWEESWQDAPALPVVIFIPSGFVEYNRYQWLGERIVRENGVAFVLYDAVVDPTGEPVLFPDTVEYDIDSPAEVLSGVFKKLEQINRVGTLAGRLDLQRVILGGHACGGRIALINANKEFFPGVIAMFGYTAHMAAGPLDGYPPASIMRLDGTVPVLLLGGTLDGVLVQSSYLYETVWADAMVPVERTYQEALDPERPACIIELKGFNHFAMVSPIDTTLAPIDLDFEAAVDKETMKDQLSYFISLFVQLHAWGDAEAKGMLRKAIRSPYVSRGACKSL